MPEPALAPPSPSRIHQAPPTRTLGISLGSIKQLQLGHCRSGWDPPTTSHRDVPGQAAANAHSWGGCARGAGSHRQCRGGVWHAPAQPHSPDWSRLLRGRRSAGTAAGPAQSTEHPGQASPAPRPGIPSTPAGHPQHPWPGIPCTPARHPQHPSQASPATPDPFSCSPQPGVTSAATSGHAVCWGSLSLATFRHPRHREPAQQLCPAGQAGAVWQCWAQLSRQSQVTATEFWGKQATGHGNEAGSTQRALRALRMGNATHACSFWALSPPKIVPQAESPQGERLRHTSVTSMWDGGLSTGTPSCPTRPPRRWLPLNAGLSASRSGQPGRGAPRGAPTNQ